MADTSTDAQTRRRRWVGAVCLLVAVAMVAADEFALKGQLPHAVFFAYWLVCLTFTLMAAGCALADLRALRRRSQEAQRSLMEETLREIERERKARLPGDSKPNSQGLD